MGTLSNLDMTSSHVGFHSCCSFGGAHSSSDFKRANWLVFVAFLNWIELNWIDPALFFISTHLAKHFLSRSDHHWDTSQLNVTKIRVPPRDIDEGVETNTGHRDVSGDDVNNRLIVLCWQRRWEYVVLHKPSMKTWLQGLSRPEALALAFLMASLGHARILKLPPGKVIHHKFHFLVLLFA